MEIENLVAAVKRLKVQTGSLVCLGCGNENSCSTKGCAILREAAAALERVDAYKNLYIDLLKAKDDDICSKCKHQMRCEGKQCPEYIEGRGGEMDGKWVDFRWTCEDLDWGDCPMMEDTPCHGCLTGDYGGFELKEEQDG